jgi:hypothetical protein
LTKIAVHDTFQSRDLGHVKAEGKRFYVYSSCRLIDLFGAVGIS